MKGTGGKEKNGRSRQSSGLHLKGKGRKKRYRQDKTDPKATNGLRKQHNRRFANIH